MASNKKKTSLTLHQHTHEVLRRLSEGAGVSMSQALGQLVRNVALNRRNEPGMTLVGDRIHHIVFGYGVIACLVGNEGQCLAYFEGYEATDLEPMYLRMEELYGRHFPRVPNMGLQLIESVGFHNCNTMGN